MANEIALFTPQARPEYALAKQEMSSLTKSLQGGGGFKGKRISIKGSVFRLVADGKEVASIEERYLDVVIIRAAEHIGRTYYAEGYDEENPTAPVCWSADGTKPDKSAAAPQAEQCAVCPQNIKGSGKDDSRACRYSQRVAVVLANDIEGDVLQLSIPAQSLFGKEEGGGNMPLQAYARLIASQNANIEQFITRLKFDLKAPSPKLFFKPMRWLTAEEAEVVKRQAQTPEAIQCVAMTVAQMDKVVAVAPPAPPAIPVVQKLEAKPVTEEEPPAPLPSVGKKRGRPAKASGNGEATPEPTLRTPPKTTEMPARSNVAQVAAQWDTDD